MNALKGLFKYIGIVLIAIVLILAFVTGLMFFIKDFSVFGYYFRQQDEVNLKLLEVEVPEENQVSLAINAKNYDVQVIPNDGDKIYITYNNSYVGYLKGTKVNGELKCVTGLSIEPTKSAEHDPEEGIFNYTITEPTGFLSMRANNKIIVSVPYIINKTVVNYNLTIKTHNGDIILDHSKYENGDFNKPLNVKSLDLTTNKGDATFDGLGDGGSKLAENVVFEKLNISTNGGTFDFRKFKTVQVNDKIVLDSKKATYHFNTLKAYYDVTSDSVKGGVEISGTTVEFRANAVYSGEQGFSYKAETGVLAVDKLLTGVVYDKYYADGKEYRVESNTIPYENTIFTDSAEINLGVVVGKLGVFNEYGEVVVNHLTHQASIRTENGNIKINKSGTFYDSTSNDTKTLNLLSKDVMYSKTSSLILYSEFGNITVGEYYQDAIMYSKKGKITATSKYADVEECKYKIYSEFDGKNEQEIKRYYYSDISTKDGKITFTTEKNPVRIIASDNATIDLKVLSILDAEYNPFNVAEGSPNYMYIAETKNGTVKAQLPLDSFTVRVECKKVSGSIGATENFRDADGNYIDVQISSNEKFENQPAIKLSGKKAELRSDV